MMEPTEILSSDLWSCKIVRITIKGYVIVEAMTEYLYFYI